MKDPLTMQPYELSLQDAQKRISNYKDTMSFLIADYNKSAVVPLSENFVKAFYIPKEDIDCLLKMVKDKGIDDVDGFRVYLGLHPNELGEVTMTLSINVTQGQGPETEEHRDVVFDDAETTGIYDFVKPCPYTCDLTSPLMEPYVKK